MARILAQMGLRAVDAEGGDAALQSRPACTPWYLWPVNARVWSFWMRLQTQWRHAGMAGVATGLDYASVLALLDRAGFTPRRRREAFEAVQDMERAVLAVWAERADRSAGR